MVWTAPPTKTNTVSNLSVSDWNTYVRDNLEALAERPTCSLRHRPDGGTPQAISDSTNTIVTFTDEDWDSHGLHSTSSNTSRITIPSGWGGIWLVIPTVTFQRGEDTGYRRIRVLVNGSGVWAASSDSPATGNARVTLQAPCLVNVSAGDYIEVEANQDSGQTINLVKGDDDDELGTTLQAIYWSDASSTSAGITLEGWGSSTDGADWWNTEVRDSFTRLRSRPACRAQTTSAISVATSTWTTLTCDTENFDNDSMHSTSVNTGRITFQRDGYYCLLGQGDFAVGSDTAPRRLRWAFNGTGTPWQASSTPVPTISTHFQCAAFHYFEAGEYAELQALHGAGVNLNVTGVISAFWFGERDRVTGAQRLDRGWVTEPFDAGAQAGTVPRSWMDIHTRDLPGLLAMPPLVSARARRARAITPGGWTKVKFNRQQFDPWNLVKGRRNFGEKFVIPTDGVYVSAGTIQIQDDQVLRARFELDVNSFTVDTGTDECSDTDHEMRTGTLVNLSSAGTIPGGLGPDIDYYIRRIDADTFTLHPSRRESQTNTTRINITSTGTGTHYYSRSTLVCKKLNLRTGTVVQFSTTGTLPSGLTASTNYYVIRTGPDKFRVAVSEEAAYDNVFVRIYDPGSGIHRVQVMEPFGSRGVRLVHSGEVQGGWLGSPSNLWTTCRPAFALMAAQAEDELWVEALTNGPEGSRISASDPISRWWTVWAAPFDYTGAEPVADRG